MLKCKHCNKSDLGVNLVTTTKEPVRLLDGEISAILGEQEVVKTIEYCFCNTCKKPITKDDLYEYVECPMCNKQVDKLVDGKCAECAKITKEMGSFSKDDLIHMLIKMQMQLDELSLSNKKKEIQKAKVEVTKEKKVPENITKLKEEDDDDDILSKIENLEANGLNFDEDEIELDDEI